MPSKAVAFTVTLSALFTWRLLCRLYRFEGNRTAADGRCRTATKGLLAPRLARLVSFRGATEGLSPENWVYLPNNRKKFVRACSITEAPNLRMFPLKIIPDRFPSCIPRRVSAAHTKTHKQAVSSSPGLIGRRVHALSFVTRPNTPSTDY